MCKIPTILIDNREQRPLSFDNLPIRGIKALPTEWATLKTGDYTIKDMEHLVTIERKSAQDLYGTIFQGRDRFQREMERMQDFKYRYLVVESTPFGFASYMEYHRNMKQFNSAFSSLMTWAERYGLKIRWCKTPAGTAEYVARLALKIWEDEKDKIV